MEEYRFFNRDLSWLGFNSRVLDEAANQRNPLFERIKFLSIFSSNLDEFYRVRMPVIAALKKIGNTGNNPCAEFVRANSGHVNVIGT